GAEEVAAGVAPARAAESVAPAAATTADSAPAAARPVAAVATAPVTEARGGTRRESVGFVSPVVRRMAEVHNLDLTKIPGTGAGGRITKKDVDAYVAGARPAGEGGGARALYKPGDNVRVEKMSIMRQKIAEHM